MLDIVRSPKVDYARDLQFRLNRLNNLRFNPTLPSTHWQEQLAEVARLSVVEGKFLEDSRQAVAARAAEAPTDPEEFHRHGLSSSKKTVPDKTTRCSPGSPKNARWTR